MMDYLIYFTTGVIIFIGLFYVYAKHKLSYWSKRGVKCPPPHLFFGNFKDGILMRKTSGDLMQQIYNSVDSDEPYVGMYIFHKPALILRDVSLIKQIMITDFENFTNRRFGFNAERDVMGMDSILSIHQNRWKYLRRKLSPLVTGHKLKQMIPLMVKSSQQMMSFLENLPLDKAGQKKYEVRDLSSRYCADLLSSILFGLDANSFNKNGSDLLILGKSLFRSFIAGLMFTIFFFVPQLSFLFTPITARYAKLCRKMFWKSINTREKTGIKRGDLLDSLLSMKNGQQDPLYKFEGDRLLAQSSSLFLAAFETASITIAYALFHLASYPEYQAILYDEIQTYLARKPSNEWTADIINEMPFAESILMETLRLFPPLPVMDRIANQDYKVPGTDLIIEKDTSVYLALNSTCRDSRFFSDPLKFNPLREDNKFFDNIVFGCGPRSCLAIRMALVFMKIALIDTISNYTLHCDINILDEKKKNNHVFTYPVDGLHVQFEKRYESAD